MKTDTNSNDLLIGYVLDSSGSMHGYRDDTIKGFNKFMEEQEAEEGETYLTLTIFNTSFDVRYAATNLKDVYPLGHHRNNYTPSGGTALYDGVAATIQGIEHWLSTNKWYEGRVLVAIWTDGQENSSRHWTINRLNDLISRKQTEGWTFVFLGAGGASWTEGNKFTAIPQVQRVFVDATPDSYHLNYAGLSNTSSVLRGTGTIDTSGYSRSEAAKGA